MKTALLITSLSVISASIVHSSIPTDPLPQSGKLAVQIIKVEHPKNVDMSSFPVLGPEELLNDGSNTLTQYPILYVDAGSAVTNDQTQTVMYPEDFEIQDGKVIPKEKPVKLGLSIATTITARTNNIVDLNLHFHTRKLKGFDEYEIEEGVKVKIPYFESRKFDTDVTIELGKWVVLGGLAENSSTRLEKTTFYLLTVKEPKLRAQTPTILSLDKSEAYIFQPEHGADEEHRTE